MGWTQDIRPLLSPDGKTIGAFFADIALEIQPLDYLHCLSIGKEEYDSAMSLPDKLYQKNYTQEEIESEPMVIRLGLLRNEHSNTYRRVGLIRWSKESVFSRSVVSEVTII